MPATTSLQKATITPLGVGDLPIISVIPELSLGTFRVILEGSHAMLGLAA
jgi:hypothetical protein